MGHLTCVGHTREELEAILGSYAEAGVAQRARAARRPAEGPARRRGRPTEGGFTYACELVELASGRGDFTVGGRRLPRRPPRRGVARARHRGAAGEAAARVPSSRSPTWCSAPSTTSTCVERAAAIGVDIPILPGIMPILNLAPGHPDGRAVRAARSRPRCARGSRRTSDDPAGAAGRGDRDGRRAVRGAARRAARPGCTSTRSTGPRRRARSSRPCGSPSDSRPTGQGSLRLHAWTLRTVTVTGQGSASVVPDSAVVRVAAARRAADVAEALSRGRRRRPTAGAVARRSRDLPPGSPALTGLAVARPPGQRRRLRGPPLAGRPLRVRRRRGRAADRAGRGGRRRARASRGCRWTWATPPPPARRPRGGVRRRPGARRAPGRPRRDDAGRGRGRSSRAASQGPGGPAPVALRAAEDDGPARARRDRGPRRRRPSPGCSPESGPTRVGRGPPGRSPGPPAPPRARRTAARSRASRAHRRRTRPGPGWSGRAAVRTVRAALPQHAQRRAAPALDQVARRPVDPDDDPVADVDPVPGQRDAATSSASRPRPWTVHAARAVGARPPVRTTSIGSPWSTTSCGRSGSARRRGRGGDDRRERGHGALRRAAPAPAAGAGRSRTRRVGVELAGRRSRPPTARPSRTTRSRAVVPVSTSTPRVAIRSASAVPDRRQAAGHRPGAEPLLEVRRDARARPGRCAGRGPRRRTGGRPRAAAARRGRPCAAAGAASRGCRAGR